MSYVFIVAGGLLIGYAAGSNWINIGLAMLGVALILMPIDNSKRL